MCERVGVIDNGGVAVLSLIDLCSAGFLFIDFLLLFVFTDISAVRPCGTVAAVYFYCVCALPKTCTNLALSLLTPP